jgi:hypothetical protein
MDKGTTVIRNKMTAIYNNAAILQIEPALSAIIPAIFGYEGAGTGSRSNETVHPRNQR